MTEETSDPPSFSSARALVHEGTFEETLTALEAVVDHLERGLLSINESVSWYELGLGLSQRCTDLLQQAELRITTIDDRFATALRDENSWDDDES